jgi:glyoxylase-like metal-dependent hydrolase (beta-lactamase superfamily II)
MKASIIVIASIILLHVPTFPQARNFYEIYAIEYAKAKDHSPVSDIAVDTKSTDSVNTSFFVWYLKGNNGRKILIDAGFVEDSTKALEYLKQYQRPDLALQRIHVNANDITDIIITHPHYDHIGGLHLFPKATVWMQKNDFAYFVGDAWQKNSYNFGLDKQDVPKIIQANLEGRLHFVNGDSIEIIPGIRGFIGSKHSYESQHLLVDTETDKVLIASDDCWYYYNLEHLVSIPLTFDRVAYVQQLRRMKTLVSNVELIIPGHDSSIFSKFKSVAEGVIRIR